jgi:Abnormal spindle-like microcephaly-assoc'd, ASPM-SPD-2-Hydin/Repeat of unknown function (DUF5648)
MRCIHALACLIGGLALASLSSAASAASRICMSADTLSFGQQAVGSSASASIVVTNCGDAPFVFTDVSRYAATNPAYRTETSCSTGMTVAPGGQCEATVWFEPTLPGQASGALWFHNTTSTPDALLTFYGRGVDAQAGTASLAFSPALVNFGDADVGRETPPLVLALQNVGSAPLVPSALVLNGSDPYDFRGETGTGASACGIGRAIAPGASCTLILHFLPQARGVRQATLVVDAPQLTALAFVPLVGNGIGASATIPVIEFHNGRDGQYFLTADPNEAALLDAGALGADWSRTGASFAAFANDTTDARALPVCRFFGTPGVGPNSHFYTAYANECAAVRKDAHWIEEGVTFHAMLPQDGRCADGDDTVLRLWNPGTSVTETRHRYVVDASIAASMQAAGWVLEGPVFCAPRNG